MAANGISWTSHCQKGSTLLVKVAPICSYEAASKATELLMQALEKQDAIDRDRISLMGVACSKRRGLLMAAWEKKSIKLLEQFRGAFYFYANGNNPCKNSSRLFSYLFNVFGWVGWLQRATNSDATVPSHVDLRTEVQHGSSLGQLSHRMHFRWRMMSMGPQVDETNRPMDFTKGQ